MWEVAEGPRDRQKKIIYQSYRKKHAVGTRTGQFYQCRWFIELNSKANMISKPVNFYEYGSMTLVLLQI